MSFRDLQAHFCLVLIIFLCLKVPNLSAEVHLQFSSVTQSCPTLWELDMNRMHARPHCPSPTPTVHPNPWPLSWWWHATISSSVVPFSCPQSFPASGSFQMSQLLASGGQSIGIAASTSVLPMNTQDWSPLGWTGWISLQSKGLSRVFSNTAVQKASILRHSAFFTVQLSHPYMTTVKTALTRWTFVDKVISLLFNMLSRLVITFLPRSKRLLISWLQSPSAVILEPRKISHCFPIYLPWSDGNEYHDLSFLNVSFKPSFSLSSFTFIKRLSSSFYYFHMCIIVAFKFWQ